MTKGNYTHRVAVNGYVIKHHKFLLLKRNTFPFIWAPPGGRLEKDENPFDGLKREIKEETNLDIEIIAPVGTWFGNWHGKFLLSIDYLTEVTGGEFRLSKEHSAAVWVAIDDLRTENPVKLNCHEGFHLKDFEEAWKLYLLIKG